MAFQCTSHIIIINEFPFLLFFPVVVAEQIQCRKVCIIEYGSTLYVGLQLKQNGCPYKAMVSKSRKEAFLKFIIMRFYD